ncbi:unnamed protein product [Urochloa decumbens]|uniref:F-box domain-containing protein n=1 Tax=Urochloa decumbens TaxID=240449 RepID=A0ABC9FL43_9POAL
MPPPPPLPDELVEEVLLRLPPEIPASLVHAGLVCKRWCLIVSDPVFHRRFREFHRPPPILGFLCDGCDIGDHQIARFMPTSLPQAGRRRRMRPSDSRHGHVLFHNYPWASFSIIVWDPIMDKRLELPEPPSLSSLDGWTAAVLCAATPSGACNHLDCHRGPFVVVLMGSKDYKVFCYVYSSESGAWSGPTTAALHDDHVGWRRSTLVKNMLYFVCATNKRTIEYDLVTRKISVIDLPGSQCKNKMCPSFIELTTTEDGRLGFTRLEDFRLCLWSREVQDARWELIKVIGLDELLPIDGTWTWTRRPSLLGSAEGVGIVFLLVGMGVFTVDLRSGRVTKVDVVPCKGAQMIIPYVNFCTPGISCQCP